MLSDEYPVVEKTSDVNLNAADSQGWTVIHHLVSPLEYGTFDNEELLYVLFKAGASLNEKDAAGLTPLNRALICGAVKLSQMLQRLQGIEPDKQVSFVLAGCFKCVAKHQRSLKTLLPTHPFAVLSQKTVNRKFYANAISANSW